MVVSISVFQFNPKLGNAAAAASKLYLNDETGNDWTSLG